MAALEAVHAVDEVLSDPPRRAETSIGLDWAGLDWPGRGEGITDRESEILALITQGKNNEANDPDGPHNGSGHNDTSSKSEVNASGGSPDQPPSMPALPPNSALEDPDGTPKKKPAG